MATQPPQDEPGRLAKLEEWDAAFAAEMKEVFPVIKSPDGLILDGMHRKDERPDWNERPLQTATTPLHKALARIIPNANRRVVSRSERRIMLVEVFKGAQAQFPEKNNKELFTWMSGILRYSDRYLRLMLPEYTDSAYHNLHAKKKVTPKPVEKEVVIEVEKSPMPESLKRELEAPVAPPAADYENPVEKMLGEDTTKLEPKPTPVVEKKAEAPKGDTSVDLYPKTEEPVDSVTFQITSFDGFKTMTPEELVRTMYGRHPNAPDTYVLTGLEKKGVIGDEAHLLIERFKPVSISKGILVMCECPICRTPLSAEDWRQIYKIRKDVDPEAAELLKTLLTSGPNAIKFTLE